MKEAAAERQANLRGDVSSKQSWLTFFGSGQRVLSDPALLQARYTRCAGDILELLKPHPGMRVMDFGCGDALAASWLLEAGIQLTLYDAAPGVSGALRRRYLGREQVSIPASDEFLSNPTPQFHAIIVHSVIQYIPRYEFLGLLEAWFALLEPGGALILSDVLSPEGCMWSDVLSLLKFGMQVGMTSATGRCLVRTFISSYRGLMCGTGLTRYRKDELCVMLTEAGFRGEVLPVNPGPFAGRLAFRGRKPPSGG